MTYDNVIIFPIPTFQEHEDGLVFLCNNYLHIPRHFSYVIDSQTDSMSSLDHTLIAYPYETTIFPET